METFRLPPDISDALDQFIVEAGEPRSRAETVMMILRDYLDVPHPVDICGE